MVILTNHHLSKNMNIFAISNNPKECAEILDDKRVVKMTLETAQIISNAIWSTGANGFYKKTHYNHPCCIWARQTKENYAWTLNLFYHLSSEYKKRFFKTHKCTENITKMFSIINKIPTGSLTQFANCTPYKQQEIFTAYKNTLIEKWKNDKRKPKWTIMPKNNWFNEIYSKI